MSVNGKVIPHTPLAVDFWQVRKCPHTRLFFLSHMHSDHIVGLTSTWSHWPIYCSPDTATLLKLKTQIKDQWIHPLELDTPHLLPLDDIGKEKLTVTLMDAKHCPGAVMFFFQGYFGSILYTADFRYCPTMLRNPCLTSTTIDVLYLDNTNCDPNRCLPSRKQATQQIKEIIRSHPQHDIVIGLYTLGKESLLVELAKEFKTWIEVTVDRMETLKVLDLPDVFTTDPGAGRIRAVDQSKICCFSLNQWNAEHPTLAIIPTSRNVVLSHPNLYVVPYSDHSSYQELEEFVFALEPSSLLPIVGECLPACLSALLSNKKRHEVLVPESVRHYMRQQFDAPLGTKTLGNLRRRPFQLLAPKGVVFDSPVKGSKRSYDDIFVDEPQCLKHDASAGEMDRENRENNSDCVPIDSNGKLTANEGRQEAGGIYSHNTVQTISGNTLTTESVLLTELSLSSTAAVENLRNSTDSETSDRSAGKQYQTNGIFNQGEPPIHYRGNDYGDDSSTVSDDEIMTQHKTHGITTNGSISISGDSNSSRRSGCGNNSDHCAAPPQKSPRHDCCTLCKILTTMTEENLSEIENNLLENPPFQEEDFQMCSLLPETVSPDTSTFLDVTT